MKHREIKRIGNEIYRLPRTYYNSLAFLEQPHPLIVKVLNAIVLIMQDVLPKEYQQQQIDWTYIKLLIRKNVITQNIQKLDVQQLPAQTYSILHNMVHHKSEFNYHDIKKASPVCGYYCQWIMEVHTYLIDKYEDKKVKFLSKSQRQIETMKLLTYS